MAKRALKLAVLEPTKSGTSHCPQASLGARHRAVSEDEEGLGQVGLVGRAVTTTAGSGRP